MIHITNNDYSLVSRFYSINKQNYEIIKTESIGYFAKETIDTVKNIYTKKIKRVKRQTLFNFTR